MRKVHIDVMIKSDMWNAFYVIDSADLCRSLYGQSIQTIIDSHGRTTTVILPGGG